MKSTPRGGGRAGEPRVAAVLEELDRGAALVQRRWRAARAGARAGRRHGQPHRRRAELTRRQRADRAQARQRPAAARARRRRVRRLRGGRARRDGLGGGLERRAARDCARVRRRQRERLVSRAPRARRPRRRPGRAVDAVPSPHGLQLASLALSPDRGRLAFVEGLSSDRGLTPGGRVASPSSGAARVRAPSHLPRAGRHLGRTGSRTCSSVRSSCTPAGTALRHGRGQLAPRRRALRPSGCARCGAARRRSASPTGPSSRSRVRVRRRGARGARDAARGLRAGTSRRPALGWRVRRTARSARGAS